jgi:hypothetical protein
VRRMQEAARVRSIHSGSSAGSVFYWSPQARAFVQLWTSD